MNEKNRPRTRQSNLELLRIIAMCMVVVMHALGHGEALGKTSFGSIQYILLWMISTLCQVAVPCFVLISGYFLCKSDFKPSRIVRLVIQVLFYTIILLLVRILFIDKSVSTTDILHAFFPITSGEYWFITQYCLLLLISPLLNRIINTISKKEYKFLLIGLTVTFSIIPTFLFWAKDNFSDGYNLPWFTLLYFLAGYIRLYGTKIRHGMSIYFLSSVICVGSRLVIGSIAYRITGSYTGAGLLYNGNSILILISSISLFSVFLKLNIHRERIAAMINTIGSCVIGVYLLHNNTAIRTELWKLIDPAKYIDGSIVVEILWVLLGSLVIFCVGVFVEWLRSLLMKVLKEQRMMEKIDEKGAVYYGKH